MGCLKTLWSLIAVTITRERPRSPAWRCADPRLGTADRRPCSWAASMRAQLGERLLAPAPMPRGALPPPTPSPRDALAPSQPPIHSRGVHNQDPQGNTQTLQRYKLASSPCGWPGRCHPSWSLSLHGGHPKSSIMGLGLPAAISRLINPQMAEKPCRGHRGPRWQRSHSQTPPALPVPHQLCPRSLWHCSSPASLHGVASPLGRHGRWDSGCRGTVPMGSGASAEV